MKVLQINTVYGIGSTGRIVKDLFKKQLQSGIEGYVVAGRADKCEESGVYILQSSIMYKLKAFICKTFGIDGFFNLYESLKAIRLIKRINPDIIHLHNLHGYYLNVGILFHYIKRRNIPVIWTVHDCWPITGRCSYFDYIGCNKWKEECCKCQQKNKYPGTKTFDFSQIMHKRKKNIYGNYKNIIFVTPSNWLASILKQSFVSDSKIKVIHNGIDLERFRTLQPNEKSGFDILMVCNGYEKRKNVEIMVEASKRFNDTERLIVLGVDKQDIREDTGKITFLDRTNSVDELVMLYNSADVLVNPTLEDNFPTVNIEALACGTPVIANLTGGNAESINEKTGIMVCSNTSEGYLNAIRTIEGWDQSATREECRKHAVNSFDSEKKYSEYISLYEHEGK